MGRVRLHPLGSVNNDDRNDRRHWLSGALSLEGMLMNATPIESLVYGLEQAAQLLDVSVDTMRRLVADGALPAFRATRGRTKGHIKIRRAAVEEFITKREAAGV